MSGRKQHFIPQCLLRGFGRPCKGAKVQVFVFTYDRGIFPAATDGVAAEREFYSKLAVEGEGETLDDKITAYENSLAATLTMLRNLGDGESADTESAAEFVTHLVVRNDHLRKFMSSAGTALFGGFADVMTDESQAKALLGLAGDEPSAMFAEQMEKAFAEFGPLIDKLGMSKQQFATWSFSHSKANFADFHAEIIGPLQQVFSELKVAETAANAHRRSLGETLTPELRVEKMKSYEWRVVHTDKPLVLPDCVAVAFDGKGEAFPLMLADIDEILTIYVPVSSDRLLVGSNERANVPSDLSDVLASCSWDFFLASERTPEFEALRDKIRTRMGKHIDEAIDDVLSEALQKYSHDR